MLNQLLDFANRLARSSAPLLVLAASVVLLQAQTVQITSPGDGAVLNPGQTFTVTVNADSSAFQTIVVVGELPIGFSQILTAPPYQFQMQIPSSISPGP
jgi:archaellum component FlaG (FlaF/FlaG flagellin family)